MDFYYYCGPKCRRCARRIACAEIKFDGDGSSLTRIGGTEPFAARCQHCGAVFLYDMMNPDDTATFVSDKPIKEFHQHPSFVSTNIETQKLFP